MLFLSKISRIRKKLSFANGKELSLLEKNFCEGLIEHFSLKLVR